MALWATVNEKLNAPMFPPSSGITIALPNPVSAAAPEPERVESLGVNPDYLTQAIAAFPADSTVSIAAWDCNTQIVLTSGEDTAYRAVVMPIRL